MVTQSPQRGTALQFSAHICCDQTAGWIKMPLGTEVDLGPSHIVLDGPSSPGKRIAAPSFRLISIVAKRSPISATAEFLSETALRNWNRSKSFWTSKVSSTAVQRMTDELEVAPHSGQVVPCTVQTGTSLRFCKTAINLDHTAGDAVNFVTCRGSVLASCSPARRPSPT